MVNLLVRLNSFRWSQPLNASELSEVRAAGTCLQHTTLPGGDAARRARDGEQLFFRQFLASHLKIVQ
jgi:hypothetical protein